jgi:hypothetical protein
MCDLDGGLRDMSSLPLASDAGGGGGRDRDDDATKISSDPSSALSSHDGDGRR